MSKGANNINENVEIYTDESILWGYAVQGTQDSEVRKAL